MTEWKRDAIVLRKVNQITDVFVVNTPALSLIKKEYGKEFMIDYLLIWFIEINNLLGNKMNDDEIITLAINIYEEFYFLTIADLKLIVLKIKKTKFFHINAVEVYKVFVEYFEDRCNQAQIVSEVEHSKNKDMSNLGGFKVREIERIRERFHIEKLNSFKNKYKE